MSPLNTRLAATYTKVGQESLAAGYGQHELVSLLFDGVLDRINLSRLAIEQKDTTNKIRHINKAIQILSEGLRTHLDLKNGGELAQNLDGLYAYCSLRLVEANAQNDLHMLNEVDALLRPVVDAWKNNRDTSAGSFEQVVTKSAAKVQLNEYPLHKSPFSKSAYAGA